MPLQTVHTPRLFYQIKLESGEVVAQESSAIGDYPDSMEKPGSSYLWFGEAQLNREDVQTLHMALLRWLGGDRLCTWEEEKPPE